MSLHVKFTTCISEVVADVPGQFVENVCVAKIFEKRKSQDLQTHLQNVLQQLLLILSANLENKH